MNSHCKCKIAVATLLAIASVLSFADEKPKKLSEPTRQKLLRDFTAETVFVRRAFPMGKEGLRIEDGNVTPSEVQVRQMVADTGPAAKPGDRAKITAVLFKGKGIIFELNGGPVKKKKWYERVSVGAGGGTATPANPAGSNPDDLYINARGSYVYLGFKDYIPDLTTDEVKKMLEPVFDFSARNQAEAYAKALPPKIQQALKDHQALVGMDREMVTYAKGRAPRKHRENDNGTEYEEWIYGEPPNDVEFIRFIGDRVVRIEQMKVDGEKIVRTQKEIDLDKDVSAMARKEDKPDEAPKGNGPTLMRPGEKPLDVHATTGAKAPVQGAPRPGDTRPQDGGVQLPDASQGPPDLGRPGDGPPH